MGILDSVTSAVNRGTESAGRAAEKVKINNKMNEVNKRRQQLAAQLGASLYLATKDDVSLRQGREGLYDSITACDAEREQLQARLAAIEAASEAVETFKCSVCGTKMAGGDLFCSGCGTPADKARAVRPAPVVGGAVCASCGAPMAADDLFCMSCGAKAGAAPANAESETPALEAANDANDASSSATDETDTYANEQTYETPEADKE